MFTFRYVCRHTYKYVYICMYKCMYIYMYICVHMNIKSTSLLYIILHMSLNNYGCQIANMTQPAITLNGHVDQTILNTCAKHKHYNSYFIYYCNLCSIMVFFIYKKIKVLKGSVKQMHLQLKTSFQHDKQHDFISSVVNVIITKLYQLQMKPCNVWQI